MSASALGAALFRQHTAMAQCVPVPQQEPQPRSAAAADSAGAPVATAQTSTPSCYGYHNTFHTHSQPGDPAAKPPTYDSLPRTEETSVKETLPTYSCSVHFEGPLGFKTEYINIFEKPCHRDRQWQDVYVILRGTQLNIHRLKTGFFSKSKKQTAGRLLHSYSLQHGEVGLALDFKKTGLLPRSPLAKLVPPNARQTVYQTDPHLFWPVREHVMRLRLETEQFLLCAPEAEGMLDWIEQLCAAVDISPPLDDRSEPRYRSLPRRGRRQRQLDGRATRQETIDLNARRLLAEQERIIATLYPNLARDSDEQAMSTGGADADADELDASDMLFPGRPSSRAGNISRSNTQNLEDGLERTETRAESLELHIVETNTSSTSAKYPFGEHPEPSPSSILRYRRRCAPVLLASSPRSSDVLFCEGIRLRVNMRKQAVSEFMESPPHYSAHHFTPADREACLRHSATSSRPDVRREASDASVALSFHRDAETELSPIASRSTQQRTDAESIELQHPHDSEPPSPTTAAQLIKVETETERGERRLLDRVKGPLTGVAEAFGGLVV